MDKKTKKIIKILNIIDTIWPNYESDINNNMGPGRKQVYSDLTLFKVFILMKLMNISSIKGIWRFLTNNNKVRKACGLESNIDRSTLSRRLSEKIKAWF